MKRVTNWLNNQGCGSGSESDLDLDPQKTRIRIKNPIRQENLNPTLEKPRSETDLMKCNLNNLISLDILRPWVFTVQTITESGLFEIRNRTYLNPDPTNTTAPNTQLQIFYNIFRDKTPFTYIRSQHINVYSFLIRIYDSVKVCYFVCISYWLVIWLTYIRPYTRYPVKYRVRVDAEFPDHP